MNHSVEKINCTVLYAEDEEQVRNSMNRILQLKFASVFSVKNGEEALDIFRQRHIDLLISDIMMPKMTGIELAREIKKKSPETPIIFTTAYNETDLFLEAIECGVDKFLLKPIDLPKLLNSISEIYETIKTKRELATQKNLLENYKRAVDVSNIVSKTDKNGIITYVNDEFCRISGYSKEELIGANQNIVRHPNMEKETFANLWKTILSKRVWKGVVENRAKNGSSYWVDATIMPILDESGEIEEFIGIRKDITDMILQEKELELLRAKNAKESVDRALALNLKKTIELNPLPSAVIDEEDRILYVNKKFISLFDQFYELEKINAIEKQSYFVGDLFAKEGLLKDYDDNYAISWKEIIKDLDEDIDTMTLPTQKRIYEFRPRVFEVRDDGKSNFILSLM